MPQNVDVPRGVLRGAGDTTAFRLAARVLDIAPVPVAYLSPSLVFLQCNAIAALRFGRSAEDIVGRPAADVVGIDSPLVEAASQAVHSLEPVASSATIGAGATPVLVTCAPDLDTRGRLLGLVVVVTDGMLEATGEEAHRELTADLAMLRAVVESSTDGIAIVEPGGSVVLYTPAMEAILGFTQDEVNAKGAGAVFLMDSEQRTRAREFAERALQDVSLDKELQVHRKDGEARWLRVRMSSVMIGGRKHLMIAATDVTKRHAAEDALQQSENLFRTIFELAPVGMAQVDADGRIVRVNQRLADLLGYQVERLQRMTFQDITHPDDLGKDLDNVRKMEAGEIDSFIIPKRYVRSNGSVMWGLLSVGAVRNADGSLRYMAGIVQDISEQKHAEDLQRARSDIDAAVHSTLEFREIMERVSVAAVQAIGCDVARVVLREGDRWVTRFGYKLPEGTERDSFTDEESPWFALVRRDRRVVAIDDVQSDMETSTERIRATGVRSVLNVPLVSRDTVIGVITFAFSSRQVRFTPALVDFADHVATSVSAALENARLYDSEHRVADTLQDAMIRMPEKLPGVKFCWLYGSATEATRIGGDFLDLFEIGDGRIGVLIGDVSGKGLAAATTTVLLKNVVRAFTHEERSPAGVLARVNTIVERETDEETFATVFFGILDPLTGWMSYCSGGHPPALVRRRNGHVEVFRQQSGLVGALPDMAYDEAFERLGPGDVLLLYTDGAIEARDPSGALFGEEMLAASLSRVSAGAGVDRICREVFEDVSSFAAGKLADDIAIMALALEPSTVRRDEGTAG